MAYVRHSTANPLGKRPWNFALSNNGLSRYYGASFAVPQPTLGKYISSPFVIPPTQQVSGPPPWAGGLGDYAVDPATMPPAPAGMQYDANYNLVPIPPPNPLVPIALLGGAGFAAWYFFLRKPKRVSLPVAA